MTVVTDDTIVATASAPGPGVRAVVRLSGADALRIVSRFVDFEGPFEPPCRGSYPARANLELVPGRRQLLPIDLLWFPALKTYTGQSCVELHFVSSPPVVEAVVELCLRHGARAAGPGEFTMRAFLAGKRDLTQAEAVHEVITAETTADLQNALARLSGEVTTPLRALRSDLLDLLADMEAGLDFTEEDIEFVARADVLNRLTAALAHLTNLRRRLDDQGGKIGHFRVALVGAPNAGKSTLFNALLGREAAIVSPVAGTTRDWLTGVLHVGEVRLELIDTAGWETPSDAITAQAQALSREEAREADLLLWCVPAGSEVATEVLPSGVAILRIATQCDRMTAPPGVLATSATTGQGIAALRRLLAEAAMKHRRPSLAPSLSRCRGHVERCLEHLRRGHHIVLFEQPMELAALEIRLALDHLGEMTGAIHTNDLLDRIFSRFCIGK